MKRPKTKNPAYNFKNPKAWVLAGKHKRENTSRETQEVEARALFSFNKHDVFDARYEIDRKGYNRLNLLKDRIARRLPRRDPLCKVPFYLRNKYVPYEGTFIPEENYQGKCVRKPSIYEPIHEMKSTLFYKRLHLLRTFILEGLVRWGYDIEAIGTEITVCKSWDGFHCKVDTQKRPNVLPISHTRLRLTVTAPLEFFKRDFYGLGEHLVVRDIEPEYRLEDGTKVLRTWSCDRMDLYNLDSPNVLKERFYVRSETKEGSGLTLNAAIKSMQYKIGKDIAVLMEKSS